MIGLVGKKVGMTRIFTEDGVSIPVTVIEIEANRVTQVKDLDNDGYRAVQVTTGSKKANRVTKPEAGLFTFCKAEFPQTTASFYASFSEVTRFWFGYTVSFFATSSNLHSTVTIVVQVFDLSNAVCFNFDNGYWDRNAIFSEDTSHAHFLTD